jgi:DNA-binding transcriptional LysR family regulator
MDAPTRIIAVARPVALRGASPSSVHDSTAQRNPQLPYAPPGCILGHGGCARYQPVRRLDNVANDFRAPDEWECRVFIAVAETHGAEAASQRLKTLRGGRYERQSVEKILKKIESWVGETLLERHADRKLYPTERGQEFLEAARAVVTQYQVMRGESPSQKLPTLACLPHHTHFVSLAEDILFYAPPESTEKIVVDYLHQNHRGEGEFHRHVVTRLLDNVYQLIIGPRVADTKTFDSTPLYHWQLEVMVDRDFEGGEMQLADLVAKYQMLAPPGDMRSRRLLEDTIAKWGIDDPGPEVRIAGETYDVGTSVMRLRGEHRRRGRGDRRVVVAPSDVALAFKVGMEFGGRHADRFKWVPIRHDGRSLRMEVCVTIRRANRDKLGGIVAALATAVERLNALPNQPGLAGAS